MPIRISKDRINMDDKVLEQPVLKDYGETVVTANSGTTYTINLTAGNVFNITLTGNCAFTFANPPVSGVAGSFTLILTQDGTGSRTVTWPGAVRWPSAVVPSLYSAAASVNIFTFLTINGGTLWFGAAGDGVDETPITPASFGWFGGGFGFSTVYRIDYTTDTNTASVRGPLSAARYALAATGTSTFGWFGGGFTTTAVSTVDRIEYATDTNTASVRGTLSTTLFGHAATGTSTFGWFGGGATVRRIDYATDTATASLRGPLSLARRELAATGTSSFGWFGGGSVSFPAVYLSTIDRIDYATDTATASLRGPLSLARRGLAATGTSTYGWFGGGFAGSSFVSTVDRIEYATDTATASLRGPLSPARRYLAATGISTYGWFGGGIGPSDRSTVDRIDYANDTATASLRGPLSLARRDLAATQNSPVN